MVALGVKQMLPCSVRRSVGCCPEGYKDAMIQRSVACWLCAGERKEERAMPGGEGEFLQASLGVLCMCGSGDGSNLATQCLKWQQP